MGILILVALSVVQHLIHDDIRGIELRIHLIAVYNNSFVTQCLRL